MKLRARAICALVGVITMSVLLLLYEENGSEGNRVLYRPRLRAIHDVDDVMNGMLHDPEKVDASKMKQFDNVHELQQQLKSKYNANDDTDTHRQENKRNRTVMHDPKIETLLRILSEEDLFNKEFFQSVTLADMTSYLGREARALSQKLPYNVVLDSTASNYQRFHHNVRAAALYDPRDPAIDGLLQDMATQRFKKLEMMEKGTELKLLVTFKNGGKAVFKPMRWGREHETLPNHYYFNDYERHNAEIAAFHLDRILGFYRVPPVTGRIVNMTSELFMLAEKALRKTFYVSPIGNLCFFGECSYYCDSRHSFCGKVDMIEGSLMVWLPEAPQGDRDRWKSPYRRSYSKFRKAEWETQMNYCNNLRRKQDPVLYPRFLPDLIDSHVFDFITGNRANRITITNVHA